MARLALRPVPSSGLLVLLVLLVLLSGTAPPPGLPLSLSVTLLPPGLSLLSPPSSSHSLPRSPSAARGPECVGISSGVCGELRGLRPTWPRSALHCRLSQACGVGGSNHTRARPGRRRGEECGSRPEDTVGGGGGEAAPARPWAIPDPEMTSPEGRELCGFDLSPVSSRGLVKAGGGLGGRPSGDPTPLRSSERGRGGLRGLEAAVWGGGSASENAEGGGWQLGERS